MTEGQWPHWLFRSPRVRFVARAFAVVLVLGFCFLVRRWQTPPDCVLVRVNNNDPAVRFICLLVETPAGPEALPYWWHYAYDMGVYRLHPNQYPGTPNGNYGTMAGLGRPANLQVSWREGDRYGVLTWDGTDDWRVWWFGRNEVPVQGSSWLFGGGDVTIRLPGGGLPADPDLLDRVGFGPGLRDRWRAVPVDPLYVAGRKCERGQYSDGVKLLQEFLAKEKDGSKRAMGLFLLATCVARSGETAKAQAAYDEAERWVTANGERLAKERDTYSRTLRRPFVTPLEGFQATALQALQEAKRRKNQEGKREGAGHRYGLPIRRVGLESPTYRVGHA
jgi:hypothetical protein